MLRRLAALLVLAPLATGCTKHGRLTAGSVMAITGIAVAAAPNETRTREGWFGGTYEDEDHGNDILGSMLLITGAALLVAGLAARDDDEQPRMVTIYPEPLPVFAVAAPVAPSIVVDAPSARTVIVADTVVVEGSPASAALASRLANRLAIQASVTARAGQCEAAVLTANKLAELDFELYERLLVTDEAVARCSTL